jgi:hypothetical protein
MLPTPFTALEQTGIQVAAGGDRHGDTRTEEPGE